MNASRSWLWTVLVFAVLGACSGGGDPALAVGDLREAGDVCPVPLDEAVAAAGLDAGGDVEVEVSEGSGNGGMEDSALDRMGGVYVECTQPTGGGEVMAVLYASEQPGAVGLVLPLVAQDLELATDDLQDIFDRVDAGDEGEIVDLGVEGPAAVAPVDVEGSESAVLYVSGAEGASPADVRAVGEELLDGL